jgi:TonB family protein
VDVDPSGRVAVDTAARDSADLDLDSTHVDSGQEAMVRGSGSHTSPPFHVVGRVLPETLSITRPSRTGRPAPTLEHAGSPTFPAAARAAGVQGIVLVVALVDESGRVVETAIARGIPELDAAAREAAARYRFAPYLDGGQPARFRVEIPVKFLLH